MGHTPPLLAVCLGSEGSHASAALVTQACAAAGIWLISSSAIASVLCFLTILCKMQRPIPPVERRIVVLDVCARNAYVCGILHLCVCICFWMILSRTPYYYMLIVFLVGILWVGVGRYFMKWSDRLHALNRSSQLLVNLLAGENDTGNSDLHAPPGLFVVGPEEGYGTYDAETEDLEAPGVGSDISSEDGKLRVAHGVPVSDISDDDLESFEDEDENEYRETLGND